jgi:cytochrome c peroxidase
MANKSAKSLICLSPWFRRGVGTLVVTTAVALSFACSDKLEITEQYGYDPKPYDFRLPSWVGTNLGPLPEPSDNPTTVAGVELGRRLFYDNRLSGNNSISCATCHTQSEAFSDFRPFSPGIHGRTGPRNAMAIINLAYAKTLFWDGRSPSLEAQAHDPVVDKVEMAAKWETVEKRINDDPSYRKAFYKAFGVASADSTLIVKALAQFERTMLSFNSPFDRYFYKGETTALSASAQRGLSLFNGKAHCNDCHSDALLTDNQMRNNGLDALPEDIGFEKVTGKASDRGKFRVPTLRNIGVSAPYMHDSRFFELKEVVAFYNTKVQANSPNLDEHMAPFSNGLGLTEQEQKDLVAFLESLTDVSFLTNKAFKQP